MPQGQVAIVDRVHQNAIRHQVVYLAQLAAAVFQFPVNAGQVFLPGVHLGMYASLVHLLFKRLTNRVDGGLPLASFLFNLTRKLRKLLRLQVTEGQIFQFRLHQRHPQAASQRRVYFPRLARLVLLLSLVHHAQCAHIMQAVS